MSMTAPPYIGYRPRTISELDEERAKTASLTSASLLQPSSSNNIEVSVDWEDLSDGSDEEVVY